MSTSIEYIIQERLVCKVRKIIANLFTIFELFIDKLKENISCYFCGKTSSD